MVKKFVKENYVNLLGQLDLPYDEMVKKLESMEYVSAKKYDRNTCTEEEHQVEEVLRMPFFNVSFLNYVKAFKTFPTQAEFIAQYWEDNKKQLAEFTSDEFKEAINNRAIRAYPSLIRDIMFAYFIKDKFKGTNADVLYNDRLDRYDNIDIMICGKYNWGIHLFTKTRRANDFRKKKDERHEDVFSNVREIDLVLDMARDRRTYGNIFLYDEIDFQNLIELCKNYKI